MLPVLSSQRSRGPSALPAGLRGNPAPPTPRSLGGAHAWVEGQDCIEGGLCGMVDRWESPVSALPLGCQHPHAPPVESGTVKYCNNCSLPQASLILGLHLSRSPQMSCTTPRCTSHGSLQPCPQSVNNVMLGPLGCRDTGTPLPLLTLFLYSGRC